MRNSAMTYEERVRIAQACDCPGATASGPRVVHVKAEPEGANLRFSFVHARLACDVCDMPWTETRTYLVPDSEPYEEE